MSLRVWLPLNGTLDNQGLDDVVVTNNGATVDNSGKIGKCYSFNGTSSFLNLSSTLMADFTECSVCFWLKINAWNSSYETYFQAGKNGASWADYIFGILRNATNSTICFTIGNGSSASNNSYITSVRTVGEWCHMSFIYSPGKCKIYLNGILDKEYTTTFVPNFAKVTEITIGHSNGNGYQTNCLMNDFRIYDHALSPMEVKQISQGLILHYPLNNNGWGQKNLLINSNIEKSGINSYQFWPFASEDIPKISGNVCTISFDAKATVNNVACDVYFRNTSIVGNSIIIPNITTEYKRYSITMTAPTSTFVSFCTRNNHNVRGASTTATYSYKNIKVELGQKATPWCPHEADELYNQLGINDNIQYDTSGYNINGVKTGNFQYDSDTPKYNVSTIFDNNYIKNLSFVYTSNTWSISLWYYFETMPSAYQGLICLSKGNGADANKKMALMPNTNKIWFKVENKSGDIASLKIQQWTHIVLTCNGSDGKIYENGVLKKTVSGISSTYTDCDDLVIGARSAATDGTSISYFLDGKISDVRIYCTALSEEDILSLYNNSAYIDNQGNIYGAIYEEV